MTTMPAVAAQPTPALFFETINAYQRSHCLRAGIELDVFTAIGEGNTTAGELARRCNASQRGMRTLRDSLAALDDDASRGHEGWQLSDTGLGDSGYSSHDRRLGHRYPRPHVLAFV